MHFEKDVFISYAHIDDQPLVEEEEGWISNFHKALEIRISQLLGERPAIWRDMKLQGNDYFGDEILQQLPQTALLITILSPRYIRSEWCVKEMLEFHTAAKENYGVRLGNKSRIFKVVKTPVPSDQQPDIIREMLGYEFYRMDSDTGKVKEFNYLFGSELEEAYWTRLDDLAHDIVGLIEKIRQEKDFTPAVMETVDQAMPTIYLAETASDLKAQREILKRELLATGCRVLPEKQLPLLDTEYAKAVDELLAQSQIAVQLVGEKYGHMPEGSDRSILYIQNELAVEKSKKDNLQRLIWLAPVEEITDTRQKSFIERLKTDESFQEGADLFEKTLETLKSTLHKRIQKLKIKKPDNQKERIYLAETSSGLRIHREEIKQLLVQLGYTVMPKDPLPIWIAEEFKNEVESLLNQCDISIHLVGRNYGVIPDGTHHSVVECQYELATEVAAKKKLEKWVWYAPDDGIDDKRQLDFIQVLQEKKQREPNHVFEVALAHTQKSVLEKLEQFQEEKNKITQADNAEVESTDVPDNFNRKIYLVCDQRDMEQIWELEDYLFELGFDVIIPLFEGDETQIREDHEENLRYCDAILIYYGAGDEFWIRSKTRDFMRMVGLRNNSPLIARGVWVAGPSTPEKERFRLHNTIIIKSLDGFKKELFEPFLEKFK